MPDPTVKVWMSTEDGRRLKFEFSQLPEIRAGETISSIVADNPIVTPDGPTFSSPGISGTKVIARFNGPFTIGQEYTVSCTVLTSAGNPITASGKIRIPA